MIYNNCYVCYFKVNNINMKTNEMNNIPEIKEILNKAGRQLLTDDDILLLTLNEIAHTFTYEEKKYSVEK